MLSLLAVMMIILSPPEASDAAPASAPAVEIGQCDPRDGEPYAWSLAMRRDVRARAQQACVSLGAAPIICLYVDEIIVRESSGRASIRHSRGNGEDGLGPMGLSLRWHADKWEGDDEDPKFCQPEVSVLVALEIMRRAIDRYNAVDIVGIQAVFGGHWRCERRDEYVRIEAGAWASVAVATSRGRLFATPLDLAVGLAVGRSGSRECFPEPKSLDICDRLRRRGYSCWEQIGVDSLGPRVRLGDRRRKAEKLVRDGVRLTQGAGSGSGSDG